MLHIDNERIKALLFQGNFGLEKESLRITPEGNLAHSRHPFPGDSHIVRDFCENQTEINTSVFSTPQEAVGALYELTAKIEQGLVKLPEPELLWPFSNPPFIVNEVDIPVAQFEGEDAQKTSYRYYLSDRYGRYLMTFCGIHVNFSFAEELLNEDFAISGEKDFTEYKNKLYLYLAEGAATYGWILTAVTAASPLLDSSYIEKGHFGGTEFNGMASSRCSELGYWNQFSPVLNYDSVQAYADSIQAYVNEGWISAPSELYYPVRLKPSGKNDLKKLRKEGIDHIELRMFDLNPLENSGLDVRDVQFAHLLLIYLACTEHPPFTKKDQVQAVQNFKNASRYDLKTVKITLPNGEVYPVVDAAIKLIALMREFYRNYSDNILRVLDFEEQKFIFPEKRYAWIIRKQYAEGFVKKGLETAKMLQEFMLNV